MYVFAEKSCVSESGGAGGVELCWAGPVRGTDGLMPDGRRVWCAILRRLKLSKSSET